MSGIQPDDGVAEDFAVFQSKSKSKGHERSWIVYRIGDNKDGIPSVLKAAESPLKDANGKRIAQEELWGAFCEEITKDAKDGAYGVFGLEYKTRDGRPADGIVFVKFLQEDRVPVMKKMLYGSTMQAFKGSLDGVFMTTLEANDKSDLDLDVLLTKLAK